MNVTRGFMGRSLDSAAGLLGSVASPPGSPSRMWGGLRRRSSAGSRGSSEPPASQEEAEGLLSGDLGRASPAATGPRPFSVGLQGVYSGHASQVHACAFSPDGCNAASASADGTVRVWAPDSGVPNSGSAARRTATIRCPAPASCLVWYPVRSEGSDAALLLLGTRSGAVKAWHCDSKRYVFEREARAGGPEILDLAAGPQVGRVAVAEGRGGEFGPRVSLLDLGQAVGEGRGPGETGLELEGDEHEVTSLDFGADGRSLLTGDSSGRLRVWDLRSARPQSVEDGSGRTGAGVACSRFGAADLSVLMLGMDGVLSEWDLRMPEERKLCVDLADHCSAEAASDPAVAPPGAPYHRFSLNSPGTHLAATSCGASAPVVRLADGAVVGLLEGHSDRVTAVAWSPAADRVLTGSRDRSLCTHKVVA